MKYKEYEIVKSAIENNLWGEAIVVIDDLLDKYKRDKELKFLREEVRLWQQLGAQIRPVRSVAVDMEVSEYIYEESSYDGNSLVLYMPTDIVYPDDLSLDVDDTDKVPG